MRPLRLVLANSANGWEAAAYTAALGRGARRPVRALALGSAKAEWATTADTRALYQQLNITCAPATRPQPNPSLTPASALPASPASSLAAGRRGAALGVIAALAHPAPTRRLRAHPPHAAAPLGPAPARRSRAATAPMRSSSPRTTRCCSTIPRVV